MKPRSPLRKISKRRSAAGEVYSIKRSRVKRSNPARKKKEFARCYGSKARVEFVKSLPCIACGCSGSQNAHIVTGGMGRKADYDKIVPLCGMHISQRSRLTTTYYIGCHMMYDQHPEDFARRWQLDMDGEARRVELAWLSFSGGSPKTGDSK